MGFRSLLALVAAWCLAVVVTTYGAVETSQPARGAQSPAAKTGLAQAPAAKPAPAPPAQSQPAPTGYVGSDTCTVCHDQEETLKGTKHAQALNPKSPAAQHGCESCHGPGQAHVDDDDKGHILKFTKATPAQASAACLNCHSAGPHAGWSGSKHEARNLTCTDRKSVV